MQFVVKRAQGSQPEWLSGPDGKDFFVGVDQVGGLFFGLLIKAWLFLLVSNCFITVNLGDALRNPAPLPNKI